MTFAAILFLALPYGVLAPTITLSLTNVGIGGVNLVFSVIPSLQQRKPHSLYFVRRTSKKTL